MSCELKFDKRNTSTTKINVLCEGTKHVVHAYFFYFVSILLPGAQSLLRKSRFFFKSDKNISHFTCRCMFFIFDRSNKTDMKSVSLIIVVLDC
jgi:hypothetical protein